MTTRIPAIRSIPSIALLSAMFVGLSACATRNDLELLQRQAAELREQIDREKQKQAKTARAAPTGKPDPAPGEQVEEGSRPKE